MKDPELLRTSIQRRLLDAKRHLAALDAAVAQFGSEFEADAFDAAWQSREPAELHRAYAVQAGYENVINAIVAAGSELCELKGWATESSSSVEVLRLLHQNGVIGAQVRQKLKDAQELRSDVQHDYANVAAREVHEAVLLVLDAAPSMIHDAALEVR